MLGSPRPTAVDTSALTDQLCALHKVVDAATRQAIRIFDATSLQSLVDDTSCKVRPLCGKVS